MQLLGLCFPVHLNMCEEREGGRRGQEGKAGEGREERKQKTFKAMTLFLVHISSTIRTSS